MKLPDKKMCPQCDVELESWWNTDSFPARPSCDWWLCVECWSMFSDYFLMGTTLSKYDEYLEENW